MGRTKSPILFATRSIESPPREGGFVLLSDIAKDLVGHEKIEPYFFSSKGEHASLHVERVFSRPGWGALIKLQFMLGLFKTAHKYKIVHSAHIPTRLNTLLMRLVTYRARMSGTLFVQTITGVPDIDASHKSMQKLVWGDHIVCQSQDTYDKLNDLGKAVSIIAPWAPDSRVSRSETRRQNTRKEYFAGFEKVVIFPGEFDRLGVDETFSECLEVFFESTKNSIVVLACRFDKMGTGKKIARQFPGKVITLGSTDNIIELLEAADLVIYPTRKMNSKFQPPLVIIESVQLGTRTLVSDLISVGESMSDLLEFQDHKTSWNSFGKRMSVIIEDSASLHTRNTEKEFNDMVTSYENIFMEMLNSTPAS